MSYPARRSAMGAASQLALAPPAFPTARLWLPRIFSDWRRSHFVPPGENLNGIRRIQMPEWPGCHNLGRTDPSAMRREPSLEDNDEMQSKGGQLLFSPSDLGNFTACEHLTQLEVAVALGERTRPSGENAFAELIQRKGLE